MPYRLCRFVVCRALPPACTDANLAYFLHCEMKKMRHSLLQMLSICNIPRRIATHHLCGVGWSGSVAKLIIFYIYDTSSCRAAPRCSRQATDNQLLLSAAPGSSPTSCNHLHQFCNTPVVTFSVIRIIPRGRDALAPLHAPYVISIASCLYIMTNAPGRVCRSGAFVVLSIYAFGRGSGLFVEVGYFKSAFIEFVVIECGLTVVFVVKAEVETRVGGL